MFATCACCDTVRVFKTQESALRDRFYCYQLCIAASTMAQTALQTRGMCHFVLRGQILLSTCTWVHPFQAWHPKHNKSKSNPMLHCAWMHPFNMRFSILFIFKLDLNASVRRWIDKQGNLLLPCSAKVVNSSLFEFKQVNYTTRISLWTSVNWITITRVRHI